MYLFQPKMNQSLTHLGLGFMGEFSIFSIRLSIVVISDLNCDAKILNLWSHSFPKSANEAN